MPQEPLQESISIVIPTVNEAENIEPLVAQIMTAMPGVREILFVDDRSNDGTPGEICSLAAAAPVRLVEREIPTLGLSGAVITGARAACGDILVVMDADLSHPPEKIPDLLQPIVIGRADMAIGSRYIPGGTTPDWPLYRKAMSRVAAATAYPLTGVHDSMCGFFAIRRVLLLELAPRATGFKIAFEAIVRGGRSLRIVEVPIEFRDRRRGKSKMSLGVAILFGFRWIAAAGRILLRRR
ncbi:MAG: polyprenol monophosphomannose synthase [Chthoniobacterales bacterium]|nr:polyprenol monophosphomannose synthase [Chthoniobacterales bacterium]